MKSLPIVALIGQTNAGKSSLLNGLLGVSKEDLLRDYLFSNFGQINATRSLASIENLYVKMLDAEDLTENVAVRVEKRCKKVLEA